MGLFDGIAGSLGAEAAQAIAAKLGIDPSLAATAIGALTQNHPVPGDTVQQSAEQTGISPDILNQVLGQIGGEGGGLEGILAGLGGAGGIAAMLDRDGDGNPINDIAGSLFGKK